MGDYYKVFKTFPFSLDPLVVTVENDIPTLEQKVNTALEAMTRWIESAELNLATAKTEAVLFTRRRRFSPPPSA